MKTSWKEMLQEAFKARGDDFKKMKTTLTKKELETKFNVDYGGTSGVPFTAWGEQFVYFPVCYDGMEWVGSAPRFPCKIKMEHQGG